MVDSKICTVCKIEKSAESFHKNKRAKTGLNPSCKLCVRNAHHRQRESISAKQKEWRQNNRERLLAYDRARDRPPRTDAVRQRERDLRRARDKADPARLEARRSRIREWHRAHPDQAKRNLANWLKRNKGTDKYILQERARNRRATEAISDGYVRRVLSQGAGIPASAVPQSLIEAKRLHIKIMRHIKR